MAYDHHVGGKPGACSLLPIEDTMLIPPKRGLGHGCASEAGATLIELSVVVAIVIIVTTLAVPAYQEWTARAELRQATTEVNGALALARVAAMNQNALTTVTVAVVGGRVQVTAVGAGRTLHQPVPMGGAVTGFAGGPVQFSSLGLRVGGGVGNQLITLTNNRGVTYSVLVTPGGKVSWCPQAACP